MLNPSGTDANAACKQMSFMLNTHTNIQAENQNIDAEWQAILSSKNPQWKGNNAYPSIVAKIRPYLPGSLSPTQVPSEIQLKATNGMIHIITSTPGTISYRKNENMPYDYFTYQNGTLM